MEKASDYLVILHLRPMCGRGALLLVRADNTETGSSTGGDGNVLGSSTVVGGKAVIFMNPASVVTSTVKDQENADGRNRSDR